MKTSIIQKNEQTSFVTQETCRGVISCRRRRITGEINDSILERWSTKLLHNGGICNMFYRGQQCPLRSEVIHQCPIEQNKFCTNLEHYAIRGYQNINEALTNCNGNYTTSFRAAILNTTDTDGEKFVTMVERSSYDRVLIIYKS